MEQTPYPRIPTVEPDAELERRVQEALYGSEPFVPEEHPLGFFLGLRNALLIEAAFVAGGLALYEWLR